MIKDTIKIGRFEVPYRIYENDGPHIVCLNGVQQSMAMWHTFICRFAPHYRIVIFDFPNQGKGKVLSGSPRVSLDEQIMILRKVMKATKVNHDLTICAASWGGVIAIAFASKHQREVRRLILASLGTKPNKKMVETIKKGSEIESENREEMAETLIKSFGQNLPENIKVKIMNQFRTMRKENLRSFYEHGLFVISSKRLSDLVDLRNLKVETTLINGEDDAIIDLEDANFLASQIPNCQTRIIKNVGHFLHLEREDVLDIYEEFLPTNNKASRPKKKVV